MAELTPLEEQVLIAIATINLYVQKPDREGVAFAGWGLFDRDPEELEDGIDKLVSRGMLRVEGEGFSLTEQGRPVAKKLSEDFTRETYEEGWTQIAQNKVCAEFCERVFGKNLCQANFADMEQLEKLIDVLDLNPDDQALDLGCGTGMITEYVSDRTEARITGIDYTSSAIRIARKRCQSKEDRLRFLQGDMNHLHLPESSFDAIISIDTLYFATDLTKTVGDLSALLKPGGRMGLFFNLSIEPGESRNRLLPENLELGKALKAHELAFQTWDCTGSLREVLQRMRDIAEELKDVFEVEGNRRKYFWSFLEGKAGLKILAENRGARYLYHVEVPS